MPEQQHPQPADHVKAHPLAEKLVIALGLTDVKIVIEGMSPVDGQPYRIRTAGTLDIRRPEHLAFVEVQPLEEQDMLIQMSRPAEHSLVLVGQFIPNTEGQVYFVEQLKEREIP